VNGRKRDEDRIRSVLETWKSKLGPARRWWPNFLFRFDDIEAVGSILKSGHLLSRHEAESRELLMRDCASPEIIAATAEEHQRCARLYFRPLTPMQFTIEGVRPPRSIVRAHCPVPVLLLFDSMEVLGREATRFSDGNLAAGDSKTGSDADFFETIPFDLVYHNDWMPLDKKSKITRHRHAEAIVPTELDLDPVKFVVCRSQAERETLLYLLDAPTRDRWSAITITKHNLHWRTWNFVEEVSFDGQRLTFRFNRSYTAAGPFRATCSIDGMESGERYTWEEDDFEIAESGILQFKVEQPEDRLRAELRFDGALVYQSELTVVSEPF
jgi:ssDNA thymidine ADP-ribosyltransferase, DarT